MGTSIGAFSSASDVAAVDGPIPDEGLPPVVIDAPAVVSERTEILEAGVTGMVSGSIDTFPQVDAQVLAFAEHNDRIYVGGKFTDVRFRAGGSADQPFLAAFDRETGAWIDTFRPDLNGAVWDLKMLDDGRLAVGGQFTNVNGETDTNAFAFLDPDTGAVAPGPRVRLRLTGSSNRTLVRAFDVDGDFLYLSGNFTRITGSDGTERRAGQIARIRISDGRVDGSFLPNVGGIVFDVDAHNDRVYIAGNFLYVNDVFTPGLGIVFASNGQLVPGLEQWVRTSSDVDRNYQQAVLAFDDEVWQTGSQHNRQVYRWTDHRLIRSWVSDPWGDGQALAELNGVVYSGSHANGSTSLYRDAVRWPSLAGATSSLPVRWMEAFDRATDEQIAWRPQIGTANGEGSWELFADSTGCLWSGGDFNRGSYDGNTPRFVRGFAKFCAADRTPPAPPTSPTATLVGAGVDLAWNPSPGDDRDAEVRYELLKNDRILASFISITTFRDVDGLATDRYFVRAMDTAGNRSATTRVFSAETGVDTSRPTTPQDLAASIDVDVDPDDVTLTWSPATDNVGVTDYILFRNGVEIGRTSETSFVVVDAPQGDSWFQVRAVDAAGNEGFKTPPIQVTITLPDVDTSPPSTPQDLAGSVNADRNIALTWTPSTDDVGVTEYIVYRNNDIVTTVTDASAVYVDPPVGDNWMQVRAVDAAGNQSFKTPPVRITVDADPGVDTNKPSTPQNVVASQNGADVTLTWGASSDDVGVTEYQVLRNGTEIGRTAETTFLWAGATVGTSWFQVRAFDAAGNQSFKTPPTQFEVEADPGIDTSNPTTPQNLAGEIVGAQAVIAWDASSDNVGVARYLVLRNGVQVGEVGGATLTAIVIANPGGNWYQIRAEDAAGNQSFKTPPLRLDR